MIYQRYMKDLKRDLQAAKGLLDSALDRRPTESDSRNEAHWDDILVAWQQVVQSRTADVAILGAMLEAIYSQQVKQGLQ